MFYFRPSKVNSQHLAVVLHVMCGVVAHRKLCYWPSPIPAESDLCVICDHRTSQAQALIGRERTLGSDAEGSGGIPWS